MKVVHIVGVPLSSGAGRGVLNLHRGLRQLGVDSKILIVGKTSIECLEHVHYFPASWFSSLFSRLLYRLECRLTERVTQSNYIYSIGLLGLNPLRNSICNDADIVNIHWVRNSPTITQISKVKKPTVLTIRDMWYFTGGCHYSNLCNGYESACKQCPAIRSSSFSRLSEYIYKKKTRLWKCNVNLHPVAISPWVKRMAEKSKIFRGRNVEMIWNSVDSNDFERFDKTLARGELGLRSGVKYVCLGAIDVFSEYKGANFLEKLISTISSKYRNDVGILVFGNNSHCLVSISKSVISFGYIKNTKELSKIYSASDVFVALSTQEAFGKTIVEALYCGVPVVAFKNTGAVEIINHGKTGFLAKNGDLDEVISGIDYLMNMEDQELVSENCVKRAYDFDILDSSTKYYQLYKNLICQK